MHEVVSRVSPGRSVQQSSVRCGTIVGMTGVRSTTTTDIRQSWQEGPSPARHIKSRARVRDLGEVYTQPREVEAMLAFVPDAFRDVDTRFLEPAAGTGNFLVAILKRKIALIDETIHGGTDHWYEFALLRCLASIYGIDISDENVEEARERMTAVVDAVYACRGEPVTAMFPVAVAAILGTNIVVGDSLNAVDRIIFVEYAPLDGERFARRRSHLEDPEMDLFYEPPAPLPTVHYSELGMA